VEVASAPPAPPPAPTPPATNDTPAPVLETTPPSPPVVTAPPRPMDDTEAREQVVVLQTSLGNLVIELDDVAAPRTCGNFRKLVSSGFYNHTIFHRVIPHFMIQGGDPNSKGNDRRTYGLGDPGYTLPAEIKLRNVAGAVAMARLPDAGNPRRESNGSQFYICVADCPTLDDKYTVFGRVIRGMNTVIKISQQPRDKNDDPNDRIEITASLETKQQALAENPQ
jgi:cyclophilin family peptidyl-prolyl cis-trans isomerase